MENRFWLKNYDPGVPHTINYPNIGAHEILNIPAYANPNQVAITFFGTETTFIQLRRLSMRMANALKKLGVQKGDRIGLHLPNCPQYIIAYYAALNAGAIVVNLNPMYTPQELTALCENTGVSTLFSFDMAMPAIKEVAKSHSLDRVIMTKMTDMVNGMPKSTDEELGLVKGWYNFYKLLDDCADIRPLRIEVAKDDPALIQFTGGTTGLPKGAVLTHGNLVAATYIIAAWIGPVFNLVPPADRITLATLPYFHVYGDIVALNASVMTSATQIVVPRFDINEIIGIMEMVQKPMFWPAVPTMINAVLNHPKANEIGLDAKFTALNSGGAPIAASLLNRGLDLGINMTEGWGMSETTSIGVSNPNQGKKKIGSIGVPIIDTEVLLVDPNDGKTPVKVGEKGELLVRGPQIMQGYWNNESETAGQLKDGWLYTGDVAIQDEDGYLYIVDRTKDMIIAGGYNIYPREIDEVLFMHPKVADAVSVGVPDDYRGETVKAFVVVKPGETLSAEELIDFCKDKLAPYKRPKLVEFRDELPKSAVGKLLRKVLRAEEEAKRKEGK